MNSSEAPPAADDARASLAAAIQRREALAERVGRTHTALDRATAHVATIDDGLKRLATAAEHQESQRAALLAQQLRDGIPVEITRTTGIDNTDERSALLASRTIAVQALDELHAEFKSVQTALASACAAVRNCALTVMRHEADAVATVIQSMESDLHQLRTLMRGVGIAENMLGQVEGSQWRRASLYTSRTLGATQPSQEPQYPGGVDPSKDAATKWAKLFGDLTKDALATLG